MIQPMNAQQAYPAQGGANAVNINILNPQAYGTTPNTLQNNMDQAPYNYTNSLYAMPQTSAYNQAGMPQSYQQLMPMPQTMTPAQIPTAAPAPMVMPESVMNQPEAPVVPVAPVAPEQAQEQPVQEAQTSEANAAQQQAPVQDTQQAQEAQTPEQAPTVDTDKLLQELKSGDAAQKEEAITEIAKQINSSPESAVQVVSEPIMNALVDIIKEDTSNLEGPTEDQIRVAEKIANKETLTPEETAIANANLSPRDYANKNRIFALYTLAMIEKYQRDELKDYAQTQQANGETPVEPLKLNELLGYNDIVNVIQNDSRPEVKIAAIQALEHVAEPEDKPMVEEALKTSLESQDETIKAAAQEAIDKLGAPNGEAQPTQQAA